MNKLVTALSLITMLFGCAAGALAQTKSSGYGYGGPVYGGPTYGGPVYGTPAYGTPVYGGVSGYGTPGYGTSGYGMPGYGMPGYRNGVAGYGSSWHPTAGSPVGQYYPGYGGGFVPGYYAPPVAVSGNYFRFGPFSAASSTYWRSPSGFYYPWGANFIANSPVIVVQQGQSQSTKPPLSTVLSDMDRYITEAKDKNKISEQDYVNTERRIKDLRRKLTGMMNDTDSSGNLDPQDDEFFRRDLDTLSREISLRVKL